MCNFCCISTYSPILRRSSMCSEWGTPHTRAPHLLRILATGNYSVRLNRFTFESTFASCGTYCSPFPKSFCKRATPPILVRMMSLLCEHKRHHPSQNIECLLYFCKKCFENLRMCNFCRTFAPCNESRRGERVG